jgi:hypothetical protein
MKTIALGLSLLFVSLVSEAQIKADYDKNTDFQSFKTYSIVGWEKNSDQILTPFDKERIINSLNTELSTRGLTKTDPGADIDITLFIVVEQKTSQTAYTTFNGGYGYRGRWGWGYGGMGSASTSYSEEDYLQGTFVLDMYHKGQLIWQGVITDTVKEKPEKREKSIPKKMKKLMKKFPVNPQK